MVVLPGDVGVGGMLACSSTKHLIVRMYTDKYGPEGRHRNCDNFTQGQRN